MERTFQVQLKIRKPVSEVFQAVADPKQLCGYFTQTASAPLTENTTVMWSFSEFPEPFPVKVGEVVKDSRIVLRWESAEGGYDTTVELDFKPLEGGATLLQIRESGWRDTPKGSESSYNNCGGWMHFSCSLKGFLEYGINLREGGVF